MTTNYEKKLLNEIKELKEGCVPKEILFAERSAHRREMLKSEEQIERMGKQIENLKGKNYIPGTILDPAAVCAVVDENKELKGEKEYWVKEYHDLKSKVDWGSIEDYSSRIDELITKNNKLYAENEELKRNGGFVGDYATATSVNALLARQKDSELKKLKEENEKVGNYLEEVREYMIKIEHPDYVSQGDECQVFDTITNNKFKEEE